MTRRRRTRHRRATIAISMVIALVVVNLIIVSIVIGGARDHDLTIKRIETIQAFNPSEAGRTMAIREMMTNTDADGDGAIGTISDDATPANDPTFGQAQVLVTVSVAGPQTTLRNKGRSGDARREVETVLE